MKPGDLIKYPHLRLGPSRRPCFAIVLQVDPVGGGVTKAHILDNGRVAWLVTSDCEVINESQ
jgi:hypothetical protein